MKHRRLGRVDYNATWQAMRDFTSARTDATEDELWLCEHAPVFTQGLAGKPEHVLDAGDIPVISTDRGGQVTFHGPGQVLAYPLVDLSRLGIFVKEYVFRVEHAVLKTLEAYGLTGHRVAGAPGIYVRFDAPFSHEVLPRSRAHMFEGLGKVAALGIKVHRHRTYHGVALNVAMDLRPFERINPCGYEGLQTVDLATLGAKADWPEVADCLAEHLSRALAP